MLSRRTFLQSSLAAVATCAVGSVYADEPKSAPINKTLKGIAAALRKLPGMDGVDEHLAEEPTKGLVQWQWAHFRPDIDEALFPQVEEVNGHLLPAMQTVRAMPDAGLDALLQEGFVEGRTGRQIREYRYAQRELISTQFTAYVPFGMDIPPRPGVVDRELNVLKNLEKPVNQIVYPYGRARHVRISPLGRFGAGYVLSTQETVDLLPAEDPVLDAKAEQAEWSGDPKDFQVWVMEKRDAHFAKLIRESKRRIVHLLVGYAHDLTDDIVAEDKISHVVVRVKGLKNTRK